MRTFMPRQGAARETADAARTPIPSNVLDALSSSGQPLGSVERTSMGSRLGHDFGRVRVHADAPAADAASSVAARAFTVGHDIVFGAGEYAPQTGPGRLLLAHELTHVVQQRAGVGEPEEAHEWQADAVAEEIDRRTPAGPPLDGLPARGVLQRQEDPNQKKEEDRGKEPTPDEPVASLPTAIAEDFVPDHAFHEILAHEIAYRNDLEGKYLYRPVRSTPAFQPPEPEQESDIVGFRSPAEPLDVGGGFAILLGEPEVLAPSPPLYYEVHALEGADLYDQASGLAAYTLTPVGRPDAPAILAFRGTEPSLADILADAEKEGPGTSAAAAFGPRIARTLEALSGAGSRIVLTGHSLGGALAQLATAAYPQLVDQLVTFNSPGISQKALQRFTSGSAGQETSPEVSHYVTRGDIVSTVGQTRLPGTTVMMDTGATRTLEKLYASDAFVAVAEATLMQAAELVQAVALGEFTQATEVVAVLSANQVGLDALKLLGETFGSLHSATMIPGGAVTGETGPEEAGWGTERLAEEISAPKVEEARVALGSAVFVGVDSLFSRTIPQILMGLVSPFAGPAMVRETLVGFASEALPTVRALVSAIEKMGGLKVLLGTVLYVNLLPPVEVTSPKPK